jgi:hypothetical protein
VEEAGKATAAAEEARRGAAEEASRLAALRAELAALKVELAAKEEATSSRDARVAAAEADCARRLESLKDAELRLRDRETEVASLQKDLLVKVPDFPDPLRHSPASSYPAGPTWAL